MQNVKKPWVNVFIQGRSHFKEEVSTGPNKRGLLNHVWKVPGSREWILHPAGNARMIKTEWYHPKHVRNDSGTSLDVSGRSELSGEGGGNFQSPPPTFGPVCTSSLN